MNFSTGSRRSPRPQRWAGGAIAAAVAVVLSACAPSTSASTDVETTGVASVEASIPGPITGIDPANTILQQNVWMLHLIGGTLYSFVPGSVDEVQPALAESSALADDQMSATVTLKPDLTFTNGEPLTAEDVAGTYTRDLDLESGIGALFYEGIETVEAVDELTVQFTFAAPKPNFEVQLALFPFAIVPDGSWSDEDFSTALVSAGQYMPEGELTGDTVTLIANPDYPGAQASIEKLVFHVVADSTAAVNQLQGGQLQMVTQLPEASASTATDFASVKNVDTWGITVLGANTSQGPLADQKVREAVGHAIDRTELSNIASYGIKQPLRGPYSSNYPGWDEAYNQIYSESADIQRAQKMLEGTECEDGCELSLTYNTSSSFYNNAVVVLQSQLAEIGIDLELLPFDQTTFNDKSFSRDFELILTGGGGFGLNQATALVLDPRGPTEAMFSRWDDPAVPEATEAVYSATKESQSAALQDLAALFATDTPWIPLTTNPNLWATTPEVGEQIFFSPTGLLDVASEPSTK